MKHKSGAQNIFYYIPQFSANFTNMDLCYPLAVFFFYLFRILKLMEVDGRL